MRYVSEELLNTTADAIVKLEIALLHFSSLNCSTICCGGSLLFVWNCTKSMRAGDLLDAILVFQFNLKFFIWIEMGDLGPDLHLNFAFQFYCCLCYVRSRYFMFVRQKCELDAVFSFSV